MTSPTLNEYYTLYNDIAAEVRHYLPQLRVKRILCPCDWDERITRINFSHELFLISLYIPTFFS
ncbi:MAG: hypothetical protein IJ887_03870 [Prevotella sp.]|nr:hypothetical protein [Prevotella sp.]MBR3480844.1 hypothetical protein [Prevotella sp.]MBR6188431.1 hypothetical protein [Prevotella sp.]